jgi:two-component system nitrogen regulation sensor histidine kinase GlnL
MNIDGLWEALPVPVFLIGGNDRVEAVNPAAEGFVNASGRAILGGPCERWLKTGLDFEALFARVRKSGTAFFVNDVDVSAGGQPAIHCDIHLAPMDPAPGTLLLMISPHKDIGRGGGREPARAAAKSAIGMAEMLAHEIKNPLAGITGAAQLLAMNLPPEDVEMTGLIVAEARRIVKLLDQVEQFGNVRPPQRAALNIHDVVDRARISAKVGFAAHVRIIEEYDPSLPLTWADADQFMQVVLNLLKNATEAVAKTGGEIRIRTYYDHGLRLRRKDGTTAVLPLQVEIVDNGPGLPDDIAAEIFDPFVSGRENGTGLGLALVSKIIIEHEGWITVDSKPGRCAFRISLPTAAQFDGEH